MTGDPTHRKQGASNTAADWMRWWETWERAAQPVSDRLVELAQIGSGDTVLDVASGLGEPAFTAARRVGGHGRVVATDSARDMLDAAARRAREDELTNVEFRVMDAATPDLEMAFDAVLCRWGFMFVPDLEDSLRRLSALLKRDGRLAAATWGAPGQVPVIQTSASALARAAPLPDAPAGCPQSMRLSDPAVLLAAMKRAGFTDLSSETLRITFEFTCAEEYTRFRRDMTTLDAQMARHHPPDLIEDAWRAVTEAARAHADEDGRLRMLNTVICYAGSRA